MELEVGKNRRPNGIYTTGELCSIYTIVFSNKIANFCLFIKLEIKKITLAMPYSIYANIISDLWEKVTIDSRIIHSLRSFWVAKICVQALPHIEISTL